MPADGGAKQNPEAVPQLEEATMETGVATGAAARANDAFVTSAIKTRGTITRKRMLDHMMRPP
jgi:hypothetical protein